MTKKQKTIIKRPYLVLISMIVLILSLSFVKVIATNSVATSGVMLARMQDQIKQYDTENSVLKQKVLIASSLDTIYQKAKTLGFVEEKTDIFVTSALPIASR